MKQPSTYRSAFAAVAIAAFLLLAGAVWRLVDDKHIVPVQAAVEYTNSAGTGRIAGTTYKGFEAGIDQPYYFRDIYFTGDTAALQHITVVYAGRQVIIPKSELALTGTAGGEKKYSLSQWLPLKRSLLPVFKNFVNWSGDAALAIKIFLHPFWLFFLLCLLLFRWFNRRIKQQQLPPLQPAEFNGGNRLWNITGWLLFCLLAAVLLVGNRYYFLQDDNYAQFTPVLLHGLDGWYQHGNFPLYNPYQLAGVPTFSYSTYAFLYPVTHLSYLTAKYLLGDVYQFCNVFALLHLAIGWWFMYRLLLRLKVHPFMALTAALCFVFCGFNLMAIRSWYYIAPVAAFVPLLAYCTVTWSGNPAVKYSLFTGLLFGLFAYGGNFQYWVYTFMFFILYKLLAGKEKILQTAGQIVITAITALLLFLPQLAATFIETGNLNRNGGGGQGIWGGMASLLVPGWHSNLPNGWGRSDLHGMDAYFYYGAFIFLLPALAAMFYSLLHGSRLRRLQPYKALLLLLALALVLCLGRPGLLWPVMAKLPVFSKFNHPFKFLLFVQFFGILAGALCWQYALQQLFTARLVRLATLVPPLMLILLTWQVSSTRQAFYVYEYTRPYAAAGWMPPGNNGLYRILPSGPLRSPDTGYDASLQMNFAMARSVPSADGYEPLNQLSPDLMQHHRQWGIRYFVQSLHKPEPNGFPPQNGQLEKFKHFNQCKLIYVTPLLRVYEDTLCECLVQLYDPAGGLLPGPVQVDYRSNGFVVSAPNNGIAKKAVLAWLWRPGIAVKVNGVRVTAQRDSIGRIVVSAPGIIKEIGLKFTPYH